MYLYLMVYLVTAMIGTNNITITITITNRNYNNIVNIVNITIDTWIGSSVSIDNLNELKRLSTVLILYRVLSSLSITL